MKSNESGQLEQRSIQRHPPLSPLEPLMKLADVERYLGIKKSTIYRAVQEGRFPAPIQVLPNTSRWLRSAVEAWVLAKAGGQ